jgi:hypothetical protein
LRIAIPVIALVFIYACSDSSGITQMQAAIDNGDYTQMVSLCELYKNNPKRKIALELGLEQMKSAYNQELIARKYFSDILSRKEADWVLVEQGASAIIENCDTIAFLKLVETQSSIPGSEFLQNAFDISSGIICPSLQKHLNNLTLINMQAAIDNGDYTQMVSLCELYKNNPKRKIALELGLEQMKSAYNQELIARKYFSDILSRKEADWVLVEQGASAIIENCDTLAFLKLVKPQSSIPGSEFLQNAFDIGSGAICPIMQRYLHNLKLINYAIDDSIGFYQSDIHKIDAIISQKQSEFQTNMDRIKEIRDMSYKEYYFYVFSSVDKPRYEVAKVKSNYEWRVSSGYSDLKGKKDLPEDMFENRHVILITSSLDIGKGLYRFNAYKSGTQIINTKDGFTQEWDIYQGVEPDELKEETRNLEKEKLKLRAYYKTLQNKREIQGKRMSIFMNTKMSYSNIFN